MFTSTRGVAAFAAFATAVVFSLASATPAHAQLTAEQVAEQLSTTSEPALRAAIEAIGLSGSSAAVVPLSNRIRAGLSPELLGMAVDTLTVLGHSEAGPVLLELLRHRRTDIRTRAVQALAVCNPPGMEPSLIAALSDTSADVRSAAAEALAEHGSAAALDALFIAFEHDILEAGPAIARLADADAARRVLAYLGVLPFRTIRPMLLAMLTRATLGERVRLDIVAQIGELATSEARGLLEEVVSGGTLTSRDPVYRAANDAAARIAE